MGARVTDCVQLLLIFQGIFLDTASVLPFTMDSGCLGRDYKKDAGPLQRIEIYFQFVPTYWDRSR